MAQKKQPDLIDMVADFLDMEIVDREAFTETVNRALLSWIAPRMYATELQRKGIISPKKADADARGTREVAK